VAVAEDGGRFRVVPVVDDVLQHADVRALGHRGEEVASFGGDNNDDVTTDKTIALVAHCDKAALARLGQIYRLTILGRAARRKYLLAR
jgi:hypothetical protein